MRDEAKARADTCYVKSFSEAPLEKLYTPPKHIQIMILEMRGGGKGEGGGGVGASCPRD